MRIAFLFSLGGYKGLTQNQEIKKNQTKHQSINRYQKRRKRKSLMQLCNYAKKMYTIYGVNQKFYLSLPILLSFNHFSNYIAIAHY